VGVGAGRPGVKKATGRQAAGGSAAGNAPPSVTTDCPFSGRDPKTV